MKLDVTSSQLERIEGLTAEFPYVLHRLHPSEISTPWHWHEELEFVYVVQGSLTVHTTTKDYIFHGTEGFFTNTNILSSMEPITECIAEAHLLNKILLSGYFRSIFETKYINPILNNKNIEIIELRGTTQEEKNILDHLRQAPWIPKNLGYEFQIRNLFSEIWMNLYQELENRQIHKESPSSVERDRLLNMLAYIQKNYDRKISLEEIACAASLSKSMCLHCFQNTIHKTPFKYLEEYRIDKAKHQLTTTNLSVTAIAFNNGFSSSAYFGKVFREVTGFTPVQFRNQKR